MFFFSSFFFILNEFRYFFVLTTPLFFNHGLGCKRKAEHKQIITIPEREEDVIQQNSSKTLMKLNSSD